MFTDNDTIQDAKSLLGQVAHAIFETITELELGASQIDAITAELRSAGGLPEEDEQLADALGDWVVASIVMSERYASRWRPCSKTKLASPRAEDEYARRRR